MLRLSKKRLVLLLGAAVLPLSVLVPVSTSTASQSASAACSPDLSVPAPAGAQVESVSAVERPGGTVTFPAQPPFPAPDPVSGVPAYCEITVVLTHPGAGDHAQVKVWAPLENWTGRFLAAGGSAYAAGDFGVALAEGVKAGYAAGSTDAGHPLDFLDVSSWALTSSGKVNQPLLENFASRSVHDLAVVGKAAAKEFYGRAVAYSYWNGCSTGGRQGYLEAQEYPDDFDGIVAAAPAINWAKWSVAAQWPNVVINQEKNVPTTCEFDAFTAAAVKACDRLDGVADGVIGRPELCKWDPAQLIGKKVVCEGKVLTISAADAAVVRKIWQGPKGLWYGLNRGAGFDGLAATAGGAAQVFPVSNAWIQYFVKQQPAFDTSKVTYRQFAELFRQSEAQYGVVIGTDEPDLSAFKKSGGKLLSWHGQADQLIFPQGTVDYRKKVERTVGAQVDDFYRLFLAPGAAHCRSGAGPAPTDPLAAVVKWVEEGKAPATLPAAGIDAGGNQVTRDLCRYPQVSVYLGHGDPANAASYRCG
ncbi:tannase/feruloyl esterase family alpha/beta hydrolase [Kribbella sancticallisti]|uniref:Tannase/feruloyl esterase family alpha/beta hydrolase n=1 Tax=Kribbella sancticallisti TaxID=460087 RepID=A0ABN2DT83_9ACTN